jgi:dTDP-4-dehydrorhamnose 3,5-epimerase
MHIFPLEILGAFLIEPELKEDERGFFARVFCKEAFKKQGLSDQLEQSNISYNFKKGTLRGMHYQRTPFAEAKLVRCTRGAIYDVVLDIRSDSPTHGKWFAVELSQENRKMLYVPEGCAHGYQTLEDNVEVFYQVSASYAPGHEGGVRWNDPAFSIVWPEPVSNISLKDTLYPDYKT